MALRINSTVKAGDVVASDSLRFTTAAGIASVFAAVVGAAIPVLDKLTSLKVSENLKIAMLGLVGAGVIGYAISSAGDVLARAYATAHVTPAATADGSPTPVLSDVVDKILATLPTLGAALEGRSAVVGTSLSQALAAQLTIAETLKKSDDAKLVQLPTPIQALDDSDNACQVLALRLDPAGNALSGLVARRGHVLEWMESSKLTVA